MVGGIDQKMFVVANGSLWYNCFVWYCKKQDEKAERFLQKILWKEKENINR